MQQRPQGPGRRDILLGGAAAIGAACLAAPGRSFAQGADRVLLLMGSGGPLLPWSPSFLAEARGYYRDEGLAIDRLYTRSGPQGIATLVSGAGTGYYTAPGELLVAVGRGQRLKVVMQQSAYHALFFLLSRDYAERHGFRADMPFAERLQIAKGFRGIRCGVTSPGSVTDHCARRVMAQLEIDPVSQAQIVPVQSVENTIAALQNGTIDAMVIPSPTADLAQSVLGAVMGFSVGRDEIAGFREVTGHVIEARAADVEANPDLFRALIRADTRALRSIIEDPDGAGAEIHRAQFAQNIDSDQWARVWASNVDAFTSPYVSRASLEAWVTGGMVPDVRDLSAVDLNDVLDMRFVDEAVRDLDWTIPG